MSEKRSKKQVPAGTSKASVSGPPEALIKALRKVLRPLVKMLLSFQVTYPFLSEMLKSLYVDVAEKDFPLEGKRQTDTRISMLTGVHRKDTKRLRAQEAEHNPMPSSVSVGAQILAVWMSDSQYLDEHGKPLALPIKSAEAPCFEELVMTVCKQDIRARVVLDEWLHLGVAEIDGNGCVRLLNEAFIPDQGLDEKAFYLGMNVSDHISAASHNLLGGQPPYLERCVYYDGLSEESIQVLNDMAKEQGMNMLKALNAKALVLQEQDEADAKATHRMNAGIYFYSEPSSETQFEPSSESQSATRSDG